MLHQRLLIGAFLLAGSGIAHAEDSVRVGEVRSIGSGATVDACARTLLRAKAAAVDVLVFARVVDSHKTPI